MDFYFQFIIAWFKGLLKYNYGKKYECLRRIENGVHFYSSETNHELLKRRIHYIETVVIVMLFLFFLLFLN